MRVSIEWFLLDNALMDFAVLAFAAALSGLRLRRAAAASLSLLGAAFALLALWKLPVLLLPIPKLLFGGALALGLRARDWRTYLRGLLCVLLCAALLGGLMLLLSLNMPGKGAGGAANGVVVGSIASRAALVGLLLALAVPRGFRALRSAARTDAHRAGLRIELDGKRMELAALVDTGNLLVEPMTGLPVVLLACDIGRAPGYPVRYAGVGGEGELMARRPQTASICVGGSWQEVDILVARAPSPIAGAQAIIGSNALPPERLGGHARKGEVHGA